MKMAASRFFFIFFLQICTIFSNSCNGKALPKFPAVLIFGDSTVDPGNNNYIPTLLRADHLPYGMDFPGQNPTGRFTDGKLFPDFIVSMLGIKKTIPPYLKPNLSNHDLRTGVSFASAGTGYDDLTAAVFNAIPMTKQLEYFKEYIERLKKIVGDEEAEKIISGALVVISAATNDFVINFYDLPVRKLHMSIGQYQNFVLHKLEDFVKGLYDLGCRVIGVAGLPPIGCVPIQLTAKSPLLRSCIHSENSDAQLYNVKLAKLLPNMRKTLNGSKILYGDIYKPLMDMINNPGKYGFVETKRGCCGTGILETGPLCSILSPLCPNPSEYMFFDSLHPTQAAYKYLTKALVKQLLPKLSRAGRD